VKLADFVPPNILSAKIWLLMPKYKFFFLWMTSPQQPQLRQLLLQNALTHTNYLLNQVNNTIQEMVSEDGFKQEKITCFF
jgi:hypothetical protein